MARGGDLGRSEAHGVKAIRLPDWDELLGSGSPWAVMLRSGATGLWLLRYTAEHVDGLEARIVDASRCATSGELFDEWAAALDFPDSFGRDWAAFHECVADLAWLPGSARGVLVMHADSLLERDAGRLPTLLDALRSAALEGERTLRVVFQAAAADDDRLAVFREFDVAELA